MLGRRVCVCVVWGDGAAEEERAEGCILGGLVGVGGVIVGGVVVVAAAAAAVGGGGAGWVLLAEVAVIDDDDVGDGIDDGDVVVVAVAVGEVC
jgi:hypothetical protein